MEGPILEGLTFDDVLLVPGKSSVLPTEGGTRDLLTRKIALNIPWFRGDGYGHRIALAIAMARQGGLGFVHRSMSIDRQAEEVDRVKRSESGMIVDPVTISPELTVRSALDMMNKYRVSGLPVTRGARLVGILDQPRPALREKSRPAVSAVMTKDNLVTVPVGTTLEEAERLLQKHRIEKLLVVDASSTSRADHR
jgi:IMP dehydrogenase